MTLLTIVEAANQFRVTRSRIYRAIERGELTPQVNDDGVKVLDPADMVRVFGNKRKSNDIKKEHVPEQNEQLVEMLKEQLRQSQEREQFYKQEITNIRKDFDDFKLLITHKPTDTPIQSTEQAEQNKTSSEHVSDAERTGQAEMVETSKMIIQDQQSEPKRRGLLGRVFNAIWE